MPKSPSLPVATTARAEIDDERAVLRPSTTRADLFAIGEVLSDTFQIRSILGAGGMGQVFEAHDRALNRHVAIKAAWPHVAAQSLRREAQAIAAIRHPSMITVYALGAHNRVEYVVMERVYGVSLAQHMDKRVRSQVPFTIAETLDILAGIADGLAAVHRAGVAHRDIKPENVMIAPGNRVILMDFGIVMPEIDAQQTGNMSGSPGYMAPETITDGVQRGDAFLVDMYALGVIAFELLIGELPYGGETISEILHAHVHDAVPDPAVLRSDCPPKLARLSRELMAKDPTERPPSMEAVAFQLRALARVPSVATPKAGEGQRAWSVLVVDDDKEIARLLGFYVKRAAPDADIRVCSEAEAALDEMTKRPPDLLLLDLHMPKMNGIEVCMYVRGTAFADSVTIVSVSAGAQQHDISLLQQLGIKHFVRKDEELGMKIGALVKELKPPT